MAQIFGFGRHGPPWLDVRLEKAGRRRRYWIRRAKQRDTWYAQVFFGEAQHRGATVDGVIAAHQFFGEFSITMRLRNIATTRVSCQIVRP